MKSKKDQKSISRRNFISKAGSGLVGGSILISSIGKAESKTKTVQKEGFVKPNETDTLALLVNSTDVKLKIDPTSTLAEILRDKLQLTGTKIACNKGECGCCTVLLNAKPVYSCHMLALDANGKEVVTIEGLLIGEKLNPLQDAFIEKDGLQCGFCTPGQVISAYALLQKIPKPTRQEIINGMSGNLCRCGAYPKIIDSIIHASEKINP